MGSTDTGSVVFVGPKQHKAILRMARGARIGFWCLALVVIILVIAWAVMNTPPSVRGLLKPTNATEFWSLITGVGTLGLCLVAGWGLNSLRLTRRDMLHRAQRDGRVTAVMRCEEFARDIIPLNLPMLSALQREKTGVFVKNPTEVRFVDVSHDELIRASAWYGGAPVEVKTGIINLLNKLEAWSMYFTAQLADADVAYEPVGAIFCSLVIQYYSPLLLLRQDPSAGNYTNVVSLYEEWLAKLTASERAKREKELLDQVVALQNRGPAGARLGKPLGYDP